MYSKFRNTTTALIVTGLMLGTGWFLGHPVAADAGTLSSPPVPIAMASATPVRFDPTVLRSHHGSRMSLAMPYYSFSLSISQRRAD